MLFGSCDVVMLSLHGSMVGVSECVARELYSLVGAVFFRIVVVVRLVMVGARS